MIDSVGEEPYRQRSNPSWKTDHKPQEKKKKKSIYVTAPWLQAHQILPKAHLTLGHQV